MLHTDMSEKAMARLRDPASRPRERVHATYIAFAFLCMSVHYALYLVFDDVYKVDNAVPRVGVGQMEKVLLVTPVRCVVRLDLDRKPKKKSD